MSAQQSHREIPPLEFLQLAGHPVRWRLLTELARSDRLVHELSESVGEPQNLISYHLAKLRDGRLVTARRSSADRRDTYYALELARIGGGLSRAGGTLHPGLRLMPRTDDNIRPRPAKVLFLCTGNSARSQMAEALLRGRSHGVVKAYSAGSDPKPLHANALRVMREAHGLDLSAYASKHLKMFAGRQFDWVISLCDRVREVCPQFPGHPQTIHWSIPNPATGESDTLTYPLFRQTVAELETRIAFLLAKLADPDPDPARRKPRRKP